MLSTIDSAYAAVSAAWDVYFPTWDMPAVWNGNGLYDSIGRDQFSDSWREGPACGGAPAPAMNAFYCTPNDTVAWDLTFLDTYYNSLGPRFVAVVIAHEVGHSVQARLRQAGQGYLVWPQAELQADCMAGAFLSQASRDATLPVSVGDEDVMYATQVAIADGESWQHRGDHGDAGERMQWFEHGIGGAKDCLTTTPPPMQPTSTPTPTAPTGPQGTLVTPSGNIRCADVGAKLQCTIKDYDFASDCGPTSQPMISMGIVDPPTVTSCAGAGLDASKPVPVAYDTPVRVGSFGCLAQQTGLTCTNANGNGFKLSRAALQFF